MSYRYLLYMGVYYIVGREICLTVSSARSGRLLAQESPKSDPFASILPGVITIHFGERIQYVSVCVCV